MNTKIIRRYVLAGLVLSSASLPHEVSATPITGLIDFEGVVTSDNADLSLATHFTFNHVTVGVGVGTFSPLVGSTITQQGITFRPIPVAPILNFWSVTQGGITYSFDMLTFGITSLHQGSHFLGLEGVGFAHATGFDDTLATWSLAATSQGGNVFTFSESTANAGGIGVHGVVPDNQSSAGLLAAGFCALGIISRRLTLAV